MYVEQDLVELEKITKEYWNVLLQSRLMIVSPRAERIKNCDIIYLTWSSNKLLFELIINELFLYRKLLVKVDHSSV